MLRAAAIREVQRPVDVNERKAVIGRDLTKCVTDNSTPIVAGYCRIMSDAYAWTAITVFSGIMRIKNILQTLACRSAEPGDS